MIFQKIDYRLNGDIEAVYTAKGSRIYNYKIIKSYYDKNKSSGYITIQGSDNNYEGTIVTVFSSRNIAKEFVRVSENDAMRKYISGEIQDYNSSPYIYNYITKDKKYYLMGNDWKLDYNGNYGFGVCFFAENYYDYTYPTIQKGTLLYTKNRRIHRRKCKAIYG